MLSSIEHQLPFHHRSASNDQHHEESVSGASSSNLKQPLDFETGGFNPKDAFPQLISESDSDGGCPVCDSSTLKSDGSWCSQCTAENPQCSKAMSMGASADDGDIDHSNIDPNIVFLEGSESEYDYDYEDKPGLVSSADD